MKKNPFFFENENVRKIIFIHFQFHLNITFLISNEYSENDAKWNNCKFHSISFKISKHFKGILILFLEL